MTLIPEDKMPLNYLTVCLSLNNIFENQNGHFVLNSTMIYTEIKSIDYKKKYTL